MQAADLGAGAINMSFGTDGGAPAVAARSARRSTTRSQGRRARRRRRRQPVEEQGDPANELQPTGTGPDLNAGRGLSVTAADFNDQRAPFAGRGSQISLAAYGSFAAAIGPDGLIGDFPGNPTRDRVHGGILFPQPACDCRTQLGSDNRFAVPPGHVDGGADRRRGRGARARR